MGSHPSADLFATRSGDMHMAKRKPELSSITCDAITAIGQDDTHYVWTFGADEWQAKQANREAYEKANPGVRVVSLLDVNADYGSEQAYIFYVADCYDPPLYLVFGSSFQDAYDTFITEFESLIAISDTDLADYDQETLTYNDNGKPVDTESVQYLPVKRIIVSDSTKASKN
jgi:hypothetical protein